MAALRNNGQLLHNGCKQLINAKPRRIWIHLERRERELSVLAEPTGRLGSTVSCGMHANREHGNCQPALETTVKSSQLVYERLCFVSPRLAHLECGFQPAVMTKTDFDEFRRTE